MRVGWIRAASIAVYSSASVVSKRSGKKIGPVSEKLALEPLVQEPKKQLRRMKSVAFRPIAEVARPLAA
jgi:hypothetical protein